MRLTHRLDHDWHTNPPHPRHLTTWAAASPALDKPLDHIRDDITSWDTPTSDAVVRPLLELAAGGDHDATRLLLVALAGALAKTAIRCPTQPAQDAFDDLVSQLAEVILTPHPLWTRALADQAIRTTTRQWLTRTVDPVPMSPYDDNVANGRHACDNDIIEVLSAEAIIVDLEQRFRLPDHTVTALRLTAFHGEDLGTTDRHHGPRMHAVRKQRQRALRRVRNAGSAQSLRTAAG
jgi:hypothetical protein